MPRIIRGPDTLKPRRHLGLIELLADELKTSQIRGQPRVEEEHFKSGAIRVDVLWDLWDGLSQADRTTIILDAYKAVEGEEYANRIALVSGWTFPEATATGMLPVLVFPSIREEDTVTLAECHRAMIDEGASILLDPGDPALRFAIKEEAEACKVRLVERVPGSEPCWIIFVEPDHYQRLRLVLSE